VKRIANCILIVLPALISTVALSNPSNVKQIEAFKNGLDMVAIAACEKKYLDVCPSATPNGHMEKYIGMQNCITKHLAEDKSCAQASAIRQYAYSSAVEIRKYGPVSVFYTTALADGIDTYYMVDNTGQLISLKDNINLLSDHTYQTLKAKYPAIAFTSLLDFSNQKADNFPADKTMASGREIIFKQVLSDGGCVACARVGVVDVAYQFNAAGVYQGAKYLTVTKI
jgi:hypothetical protein